MSIAYRNDLQALKAELAQITPHLSHRIRCELCWEKVPAKECSLLGGYLICDVCKPCVEAIVEERAAQQADIQLAEQAAQPFDAIRARRWRGTPKSRPRPDDLLGAVGT